MKAVLLVLAALSVHGDRFAIDGQDRFLVFVSYFDGMHRPVTSSIDADLEYLKSKGVDGIRVFPDWHVPRLMDSTGAVDSERLEFLLALVEIADRKGMMVDLSFDPELPKITNVDHFREGSDGIGGLERVAKALLDAGRRNVMIDLCNEWDLHCGPFGAAGLKGIKDAIKAVDPHRLVVVSARSEDQAVAFVKDHGFDAVTFHDRRDHAPARSPRDNWATRTGSVIGDLKARLKASGLLAPVYLQEPSRFVRPGEHRSDTDDDPSRFGLALENARKAGAAAWTFHTLAGGELSGPEPFSSLLLPGEQAVLDNLR
jgi:hypothetical protein